MSDEIEQTAQQLERSARDNGTFLSGDLRVSEQDASALLGMSSGHLKNLRLAGAGPSFYRIGIQGSKVSYRLESLAQWLETKRDVSSDNAIDAES